MGTDDFAALVGVDLTAAYGLTRVVAERLVATGRPGSVINISSIAGGTLGNVDDVAYQAAKAGLEGLTRALAADLGPYGIRVNAVAPGTFVTEVNAEDFARPEWQEWIGRRSALGRFGRPEEIAGVVTSWPPTRPPTSPARSSPSTAASPPTTEQAGIAARVSCPERTNASAYGRQPEAKRVSVSWPRRQQQTSADPHRVCANLSHPLGQGRPSEHRIRRPTLLDAA